jgi:hypothetical protein
VDNIKMDLEDMGLGVVDSTGMAQDGDKWGSSCECGNEPSGSIKCSETTEWLHN